MKLKNKINKSIPVYDMQDGEIGVITEWGISYECIGWIVLRFKDDIIALGRDKPISWPIVLFSNCENMRVEILPKGTELIV